MNNDNLYHSVFEYARMKHKGQFRKDGIEEYINHPFRVSQIVRMHGGTIEQQCAALLHDVVEDCDTTIEQLTEDLFYMNKVQADKMPLRLPLKLPVPDKEWMDHFDWVIATTHIVDNLTCKYTPQAYPHLNREKRKKLEIAEFLKLADEGSKIVKFADIIDNLSAIEKLDEAFAEKYLFEDFRIIRALKINHSIYTRVTEVFKEAVGKLL